MVAGVHPEPGARDAGAGRKGLSSHGRSTDSRMTGAEYTAFLGAALILAVTPGPDTFLTLRYGAQSFRRGLIYASAAACGITVWAVLALSGLAALLQTYPAARTVLAVCGGLYLTFLGLRTLWGVWQVERRIRAGARAVVVPYAAAEAPASVAASAGAATPSAAGVAASAGSARHAGAVGGGADTLTREPAVVPAEGAVAPSADGGVLGAEARARRRSPFPVGLLSSLTNPKTGMFFLALFPAFLPREQGLVLLAGLVLTIVAVFALYSLVLVASAAGLGRRLESRRGTLIMDLVSGGVLVLLGLSIPFL